MTANRNLKLVEREPFNARSYAADYLNAKRLKAEQAIIYTGLYSVYPRAHRVIEQRQRGATTEPTCTQARLAWRASRRMEEVEQATTNIWLRMWKRLCKALF